MNYSEYVKSFIQDSETEKMLKSEIGDALVKVQNLKSETGKKTEDMIHSEFPDASGELICGPENAILSIYRKNDSGRIEFRFEKNQETGARKFMSIYIKETIDSNNEVYSFLPETSDETDFILDIKNILETSVDDLSDSIDSIKELFKKLEQAREARHFNIEFLSRIENILARRKENSSKLYLRLTPADSYDDKGFGLNPNHLLYCGQERYVMSGEWYEAMTLVEKLPMPQDIAQDSVYIDIENISLADGTPVMSADIQAMKRLDISTDEIDMSIYPNINNESSVSTNDM